MHMALRLPRDPRKRLAIWLLVGGLVAFGVSWIPWLGSQLVGYGTYVILGVAVVEFVVDKWGYYVTRRWLRWLMPYAGTIMVVLFALSFTRFITIPLLALVAITEGQIGRPPEALHSDPLDLG